MEVVTIKEAPQLKLDSTGAETLAIFGSSKRGKSTLIYEIYKKYYQKRTDIITILISPSCHIGIFAKLPKKVLKVNKFSKETIQLLQDLKKVQNKTNNAYKFLIIIDDCVDVRFNKILNQLILVMRNSLFSTIISLQYCMLLSKPARSSVNNIISFGVNSDEGIECILRSYLKTELTKKTGLTRISELMEIYRTYTDSNDGHSFFVYNPQSRDLQLNTLKL